MAGTQKVFALILGIVLLLVGLAGFIPGGLGLVDGGYFGTNNIQDVLHIIAGLIGIWIGLKGEGPGYNMSIGWIGVVLGILGFIPTVDALLLTYLNINTNISVLHLVIGIVALGVYYFAEK